MGCIFVNVYRLLSLSQYIRSN